MVDIHSHVLWGLDDGAKSYEETLEMLRVASMSGTTDLVATPHSNNRYLFDPEQIEQRINQLSSGSQPSPQLHRGCDFHLSLTNIEAALQNPARFTINHRNYLLVEFPDLSIPPGIDAVFSEFLKRNMVPILTHPERNDALMKDVDQLARWAERGCLFQVTAMSLLGDFGPRPMKHAWDLVERRLIHFVASDAHDPVRRHPRLDDAFARMSKQIGESNAELLFVSNPRVVIEGGNPLEIAAPAAAPKRRWFFGGR